MASDDQTPAAATASELRHLLGSPPNRFYIGSARAIARQAVSQIGNFSRRPG